MMTAADSTFDGSILTREQTHTAAAAPARPAPVAPPMSASLWRQTLAQDNTERSHHAATRLIFAIIAALSLSSVGYAAWTTYTLLDGHHLDDAIAAFVR